VPPEPVALVRGEKLSGQDMAALSVEELQVALPPLL
jgi:hypothetical protein